MSRLPNQWISWDHEYVTWDTEESASGRSGQFLYALKDTVEGDRQVVLEGGTDRGIISVVDFAGHNRKRGAIYYAWGAVTDLCEAVDASSIGADPILSQAFRNRQGRAKHLTLEAAMRLDQLTAGLPEQQFPDDAPTEDDELDLWTGARGREPEFLIQDEVEATKRLWHQIGFRSAPRRGHRLQNGTYPDLYSADGVVGEVKNVVGPRWGPGQLLSYVRQLNREEPDKAPWKGVLIHGAETLSAASRRELSKTPPEIDITVWSIKPGRGRRKGEKQFP